MPDPRINLPRLLERLQQLGDSARDTRGRLARSALSDADRVGRDLLCTWMRDTGLRVSIDAIGNIFGSWHGELDAAPLMIGSHIDSVIDAGIYDGCYGVLSGLAVIEALEERGIQPGCPLVVAAFTNEEGHRYAPDMMGSLVHAGGLDLDVALATVGVDGSVLGEELRRIGYAGDMLPGTIRPRAFIDLHIEQGPLLEHDGIAIGAVENLQGISWQEITIDGVANHAGTTPTRLRRDAGLAAARIVTFLRDELALPGASTVATVGSIRLHPNVINVIASSATLSVDLRDPDSERFAEAESLLAQFLAELAIREEVEISARQLARFEPVSFAGELVELVEQAAATLALSCRRMTSGAGHDAQMMARICPAAMIFVPSRDGISHNPREHTDPEDLRAGAEVLLEVILRLLAAAR